MQREGGDGKYKVLPLTINSLFTCFNIDIGVVDNGGRYIKRILSWLSITMRVTAFWKYMYNTIHFNRHRYVPQNTFESWEKVRTPLLMKVQQLPMREEDRIN